MIKNSPESKKNLKTRFGETMWQKIKERNQLPEISAESEINLAQANKLLETNSLVIYANHTSSRDAEVGVALALSRLTNAKRFLAPAGMKHYDLKRNLQNKSMNGILLRALRVLNVHIIPVVQKNDLERYSQEKREKLLQQLKARTEKLFAKKGSVYGITPEGTRNRETGELQQANTGIAKLEKYAPKDSPLVYVPIAITFNTFSEKPEVVVGKPQTLAQTIHSAQIEVTTPQEITDMHMYRLSALMQEHMRGYYK